MRRISADAIDMTREDPVDAATLEGATKIVNAVRTGGDAALRRYAIEFGDLTETAPIVLDREALTAALDEIPSDDRALLERTAQRIRRFATAQRRTLGDLTTGVAGGRAGHEWVPVDTAGCYAPGGRYPLPSSVLMTAVTARAAGVAKVWVASPRPTAMTKAAAAVAGADALLTVGGAQAIAALAYGTESVPRCDAVVGPGNRWVTAAKQLVAGRVAIDMLAGPSELVVVADEHADPEIVAADLLAQAEHDPDALPVLITTSVEFADRVDAQLASQLADLPTATVARAALGNGFTLVVADLAEAVDTVDVLAPEHLELHIRGDLPRAPRHFGALFVGRGAAEVLGDYGAGPNHVLPTSGSARFVGGLSVLTFSRLRTWLRIDHLDAARPMVDDAIALARHEGLEAHARAAELRRSSEVRKPDCYPIDLADVYEAEARIRPFLPVTPLRRYVPLDDAIGRGITVFVKHENHQPTNAFKARNGLSLLTALSTDERARGVVAATRGNHGQGIAWAGSLLDTRVTICVPIANNVEKNTAMKAYGATLIEQGGDYDEAVEVMAQLAAQHGLTVAHSTNDPRIIAGAATMTLEMLEQEPTLDAIVLAIGGGSQAVGALVVAKALAPDVEIYGVQAARAAATHDSWHARERIVADSADTFADGLATRQPYEMTFPALQDGLTDFVTVSESEIAHAVRLLLSTTHNIAEGAGAAGLAGLIKLGDRLANKSVAVVISGGNIDSETLKRVLDGAI